MSGKDDSSLTADAAPSSSVVGPKDVVKLDSRNEGDAEASLHVAPWTPAQKTTMGFMVGAAIGMFVGACCMLSTVSAAVAAGGFIVLMVGLGIYVAAGLIGGALAAWEDCKKANSAEMQLA